MVAVPAGAEELSRFETCRIRGCVEITSVSADLDTLHLDPANGPQETKLYVQILATGETPDVAAVGIAVGVYRTVPIFQPGPYLSFEPKLSEMEAVSTGRLSVIELTVRVPEDAPRLPNDLEEAIIEVRASFHRLRPGTLAIVTAEETLPVDRVSIRLRP